MTKRLTKQQQIERLEARVRDLEKACESGDKALRDQCKRAEQLDLDNSKAYSDLRAAREEKQLIEAKLMASIQDTLRWRRVVHLLSTDELVPGGLPVNWQRMIRQY